VIDVQDLIHLAHRNYHALADHAFCRGVAGSYHGHRLAISGSLAHYRLDVRDLLGRIEVAFGNIEVDLTILVR
jgi:hypothetical protein